MKRIVGILSSKKLQYTVLRKLPDFPLYEIVIPSGMDNVIAIARLYGAPTHRTCQNVVSRRFRAWCQNVILREVLHWICTYWWFPSWVCCTDGHLCIWNMKLGSLFDVLNTNMICYPLPDRISLAQGSSLLLEAIRNRWRLSLFLGWFPFFHSCLLVYQRLEHATH